jgi:hypothetical protein
MTTPEFTAFPKMARLTRECVVTEKIDGTNAQIYITPEGDFFAGSRTRWITPENDNHGFARWAYDHKNELMQLGPGRHFGEWWGSGIQRNYGLTEKRWSLFNTLRWCLHDEEPKQIPTADPRVVKTQDRLPACCHLVPVLWTGEFNTTAAQFCLMTLEANGSLAAPGFMQPEGIVVFHTAGNVGFKKTIHGDQVPKTLNGNNRAMSQP